ncbi:glucosyltransferase domain-containing protein [Candidatus Saccharibacteria bacterium]|nr:glucosyltransferase domain-containing protein [Candidatus Saccharibacteria bacterium]
MKKRDWKARAGSFVKENRFLVKPFLVMMVIYLVGISAIILAGVHYADDVARTNFGYSGWTGFSRYFSTIMAFGLHADGYLTNIYPLPQILAVVILAVASIMLICIISGKEVFKEKPSKWILRIIAVVPLGLSPYMLECLAYQYDAPYMAVSVLFAVMPLLFRNCPKWVYGLAIFVGVTVVCTSYQAAVGIMPMLVVMVAVKKWSEGETRKKWENVKFVLLSAVVFAVSLLFFQKILMKPRDAYVSNSLPSIDKLVPEFFGHLGEYFELVFSDFKILWLVIIGVICVGFLVIFVMRTKRNKILASATALMMVVLVFVMAFAFYALLDKPLYATRAMYPFGVSMAVISVYVVNDYRLFAKIMRVPVVILSWCFLVFAMTFGNALREQDEYRNMLQDMVISDLNEMPIMLDQTPKYIKVSGNLGFSPVILHMPQDYKILDRLLMPSFSEYIPWMATKITEQSGLPNLLFNESVDFEGMDLPILKETVFYDILGNDEYILVRFKDNRKFDVKF